MPAKVSKLYAISEELGKFIIRVPDDNLPVPGGYYTYPARDADLYCRRMVYADKVWYAEQGDWVIVKDTKDYRYTPRPELTLSDVDKAEILLMAQEVNPSVAGAKIPRPRPLK